MSDLKFPRRILANRAAGLGLITVMLFAAVTAFYPQFANLANVRDSFDDTAILILLALGEMLVIVTGAIDLSVAANVAFTGLCVALLNHAAPGIPVGLLLAAAAAFGAFLGLINGALVWQLNIPPIVVTLGTMAIFRGFAYLISGGGWVNSGDMTRSFLELPRQVWMGLSLLSWLATLSVALAAIFLKFTTTGRHLYTAGNNAKAASYVGVNVGRTQCTAFILCGALAGLSGYLWVARFAVAYSGVASGFELTVIASCVIGGIAITGGSGTVVGLGLGCLFLGVIKNALPLLGVSAFWQLAVSGAVIVGAVVANAANRKPRQRILEAAGP
jgi:rhamnose transport system permease protein